MSANAADATSGPDNPLGTPAPAPRETARSLRAAIAAFPIAIGQACTWLFNLLQNSNALYSLKTFCAAMLALYISFRLDFSQPRWAFMTVYIVSQPLAGMVLSKSFARIAGTLIGAVVAVVFVALFNDMQLLFVGVMAACLGACLYVSIWLREKPAAYGAMLTGYTAVIIGFSAISAPETAFDTATTRCLEILLGIVVATAVSRVVLPRTSGRVFRQRVAGTLAAMKRCMTDTLRGHNDDARGLLDLRKLIADSFALETLRIHASRDTPGVRAAEDIVRALQGRILSVTSILVSIHDRLALLRRDRPQDAAALAPLFARVIERIELLSAQPSPHPVAGRSNTLPSEIQNSHAPSLTGELFSHLPDFETLRRSPGRVLDYIILSRLVDLLAQWQEINRLNHLLVTGGSLARANIPLPPPEDSQIAHYRDHSLARISAIGAATALAGTCALWILTGWPNGASAATFAGVVSCTVALQDNPARNALRTLRSCIFAAAFAAIYLFGILPRLDGFGQLALALAVFYVPLGMMAPSARLGPIATPILIYSASFMSLQNITAPGFADFINSATALMTGILAAVVCFRLLRPVGTDWPLRRHTAGMMRDLAELASTGEPGSRAHFETRMLDRKNAIIGRLNPGKPGEYDRLRGTLTALRVGLNIRLLAIAQRDAPPQHARPVRDALDALAAHFAQLARRPATIRADTGRELFSALDHAIQTILAAPPGAHPRALDTHVSLSAIRTTLLQHADFYGLQAIASQQRQTAPPLKPENPAPLTPPCSKN